MDDKNNTPKPSFEKRMEALTMNLELTVHAMESLRTAVISIHSVVEAHDSQIDKLISLAKMQNDRITRLEGGGV